MNFLVGVLGHAAPDHGAVQRVQRGEQRRGAVALVIVRHRPTLAGLQRQAGLGAVERLDLALLVDRQHHRVAGRIHVEPDDVLHLGGERGIGGALEGAQPMRLEAVGLPDALHGAQADADHLGHGPPGPVGDGTGRLRAGQGQNLGDGRRGQRSLAGFARLVAQQPVHALFSVMHLPSPHRRAADTRAPGDLQDGQPFGREHNEGRPLHMLLRAVAVAEDRRQARAVLGANDDADSLGHAGENRTPADRCESYFYVSALALLWQFYWGLCRASQHRQQGHRSGAQVRICARMAWRMAGNVG